MAELVMFFGIGFFVVALLGSLSVLYVHNRFARLGASTNPTPTSVSLSKSLQSRLKIEASCNARSRR